MVLLLLLLLTCRDVHGNVNAANGSVSTCVDADCVVFAYVDVDGCIVGDVVVVVDDADVLNILC